MKTISQAGGFLVVGSQDFFLEKVGSFLGEKGLNLTNNPNLLFLNEPQTGIEEIRKLKGFFTRKKWLEKEKRLVLLAHGEGLSLEAQNALLKTLEEVRKNNYIFISVPNQETLIPTIVSRCQIIHSPNNQTKEGSQPALDFFSLKKLPLADRLASVAPKKINAQELEQIIAYYQKQLVKENFENLKLLKGWLNLCLQAQKMLEANMKIETAVDWLLLNL
ncbi:hypothetical protein ISS42_03315 [Candidatus Shapirobacteria bacterium]|nr:hypothetical protein [Candidatus Shapirobacteria bacterium]